jgi:hypothetical protein
MKRNFLVLAAILAIFLALYVSSRQFDRLRDEGKLVQGFIIDVVTDSKSTNISVVFEFQVKGRTYRGSTQVFCDKLECYHAASKFLKKRPVMVIYDSKDPELNDAVLASRQIKFFGVKEDALFNPVVRFVDSLEGG